MAVKQSRGVTKSSLRSPKGFVPRAYLRLMERFLLRPINDDRELAEAAAMLDELASRKDPLLPEEQEYFDVLCDLIERYEDITIPMPDVSAAEMLAFLIEQRGVLQQTVAKETGIANSTLSALLRGTRELTRKHIEKLAAYFGVEGGVFLA